VLRADHVSVEYAAGGRPVRAVRDVSWSCAAARCSASRRERLRQVHPRLRADRDAAAARRADRGLRIEYAGPDGRAIDLATASREELRQLRWNTVSMVFQSAMNALNPVTSVDRQFDDIFRTHRPEMDRPERVERIPELLEMVGIDPAGGGPSRTSCPAACASAW
jgi:peptide/nickel transport system ATP-binding protein